MISVLALISGCVGEQLSSSKKHRFWSLFRLLAASREVERWVSQTRSTRPPLASTPFGGKGTTYSPPYKPLGSPGRRTDCNSLHHWGTGPEMVRLAGCEEVSIRNAKR
eukprot:scaffold844_cov254-Pinguiococcus_pyrenoidosus.AAC.1